MSLKGTIKVSGDKSITHRAIILSSLAKGKTGHSRSIYLVRIV